MPQNELYGNRKIPDSYLRRMKKIINNLKVLLLALGLLGLSSVHGQIVSSNVATYITVDITPGKYHLVSIPFTSSAQGGPLTPSVLFAGQTNLPVGTTLEFYDNTNQVFITNSQALLPFGWFPDDKVLNFTTFWLFVPDVGSGNFQLLLTGIVPSAETRPNFSKLIQQPQSGNPFGFNYIGYDYPVPILWTDTDLAAKGSVGDTIYQYDPNVGYFGSASRLPFGWFPSDLQLLPGRAYLYANGSAGTLTWDEVKPYSWP